MSNAAATLGFAILVLMFAAPMALPNLPAHALTQSMIITLAFIVIVTSE